MQINSFEKKRRRSDTLSAFFLIFGFTVLSMNIYAAVASPDFLASWLAGKAWVAGETQNIYPPLEHGLFDLIAPRAWYEALTVGTETEEVFPFIYPPIWAVLFGELTKVTNYETLRTIAALINPVLLSFCILLAGRVCERRFPVVPTLIIGMIFFSFSAIGQIALMQNQFQILVSFLILLSIERARNGHEIIGGTALALAAGIKLYPAIFIILFWAAGYRKATLAFVATGLALGLTSLALTGWPLHAIFLNAVSTISNTVLVTPVSWSFDPLVGQIFFEDTLVKRPFPDWGYMYDLVPEDGLGFFYMPKPWLWQMISTLMLIGTLIVGALMIRRAHRSGADSGWVWAFIMGLFALVNPLSWSYHFIVVAAFAPFFVFRIGLTRGVPWIVAIIALTSNFAPDLAYWLQGRFHWPLVPFQPFGTILMTVLVGSFGYSAYRKY